MPCIDAITPSWPNRGMSCGVQMLRVFDSPAEIALRRVRLERLLEDVQRLAVRAVANRVHAELKVVRHRQARGLGDIGDARRVQAGAVRLVGVGLEQPGPT